MVAVLAVANFFITLMRNKGALNFFSTVFSLAVSFTSGVFVPLELIQTPVQKVASFMPTVWAVKANNAIVHMPEQAPDYSFVWQAMGIMAPDGGCLPMSHPRGWRKSRQRSFA